MKTRKKIQSKTRSECEINIWKLSMVNAKCPTEKVNYKPKDIEIF